jgi:hypothetical protein
MNIKNSINNSTSALLKPLNEGYEKLIKNFDNISIVMSKYNGLISNAFISSSEHSDYIKSFSYIVKSFSDLKENFKDFYISITDVNINYINYLEI